MGALVACRDLAPKDRNGASDPFVRVRYNGRTQETSVRTLRGRERPGARGPAQALTASSSITITGEVS